MNIIADVNYSEFIVESSGQVYRMRRVSSIPAVNGFAVRWDVHKQVGWVKIQDHTELENDYQKRIAVVPKPIPIEPGSKPVQKSKKVA